MLDLKEIESEVLDFWEKNKIYDKVKSKNSGGERFYFLQGPPYTSGKIHIGHAWNYSLKDMALRYKRMKGFNVWDRSGYDMHGLPTSQKVQKKLKLKNKDEIVKYGVGKFVKACMDYSIEHMNYMNEDFKKLGVWMDHENAYKPIEKEYIDGEWAFFYKSWKEKRLYRGLKVMHWDSETETALAKHELEYKNVKDTSVFLKFAKKNSPGDYFLIWTTTPWTIPFNLAIMVNPELKYVRAKVDGEIWTVAKDLAGPFISGLLGKKLEILEEFTGADLEGQEYVHPFENELGEIYSKLKKESPKVHSVILSSEYVDTTAGTGLVHCAPGCGPEDFEVGAKYGILPFNILNERGEFENFGKYSGWKAKDDDEKFIREFEKVGALVAKTEVEHEYPHSDRSKKPVIFRTTEQWFLKVGDLVPKLLDINEDVYWVPKKSGENYDRWAQNLRDNSLTRQRFWGCPVPIWVNEEDVEDYLVVGSVKELEKYAGKKLDNLHLHKPYIDDIIIKKGNKSYRRIPDVADVWIDSGTASWNSLYNDPKLIKKWFPADLVLEGIEQTKLWFSLLQICSEVMFGKGCYKNVYAHGMILDFQGVKMSKSLGNIISPYEVIDKFSVDVFRNYICGLAAGETISFSWEDIKVKQRNLFILANLANYILDLERQCPKPGKAGVEEKWILSRYHSTLKDVSELFENYKLDRTIGKIENLFMMLSRDYVKFSREKAGKNGAVLEIIKEVYFGVLKMFAPVCPHVTEHLWKRVGGKEKSVHLCNWPKYDAKKINKKLEDEFDEVKKIIEVGLALRDKKQVGLKWPLKKATIHGGVGLKKELVEIIAKQLNVKKIDFIEGRKFSVELDFEMTPELEAEGFSRELARRVQSERKKLKMKKEDVIELAVEADKELVKMFNANIDFLMERTNSGKIDFIDVKGLESVTNFKIRGKKVSIVIL